MIISRICEVVGLLNCTEIIPMNVGHGYLLHYQIIVLPFVTMYLRQTINI